MVDIEHSLSSLYLLPFPFQLSLLPLRQIPNSKLKNILLFGAGKSSTALIDYLLKETGPLNWQVTLADSNPSAARAKLGSAQNAVAVDLNVEDNKQRRNLIKEADIVISLLPPALHFLVAKDCLHFEKDLLTASYIDDAIRSLESSLTGKGVLFLCEMGLDPGIDHMSAMQIVHGLREKGAKITSFYSHCGGLVAPESDDNPWRYKISWNPRNVVLAGKSGAIYREAGKEKRMDYESLFDPLRTVNVEELGRLAWYPNRDSRSYMPLYGMEKVENFVRTTLRYPEFCFGWKNIIELALTDETIQYDTNGLTLQQFFQQHFANHGFSQWMEKQLTKRFENTQQLLENLMQLLKAESAEDVEEMRDFLMVDDAGQLEEVNLDDVKNKAAMTVAGQMHEANLSMKQLIYLGMEDNETLINKGKCSAADILQLALEQKLALKPGDKDMIVMLHEIEYEIKKEKHKVESCLIVKGDDHVHTAMAKTVGLPLGIAAMLILQKKIRLSGLHIPVLPEIYEPVMKELANYGIAFRESQPF